MDYAYDEDEEVDIEVLNTPPAVFQTPRKKRVVKVREQLDDSFLTRSKRISSKLDGFKNAESAKMAKQATETQVEEEPMPLAVTLGPAAAPHLSKEILEGIATSFLQIQPKAASAALLNCDTLDE